MGKEYAHLFFEKEYAYLLEKKNLIKKVIFVSRKNSSKKNQPYIYSILKSQPYLKNIILKQV